MKNAMLLLTVLAIASVSFGQIKFEKIGFEKAKEKALKENKLIFIDVYATWCGPCKMLDKNVFSNKSLGETINSNFVALKIDGDKDENVMTMIEFDIEAFPTLILIDPKTNRQIKLVGYIETEDLTEEVNYFIHPDSHPVNKLMAGIKGEFSQENHRELIQLLIDDRSENNEAVNEAIENYVTQFSDLDLKNSVDLLIFSVRFHEWSHPLVKYMIENPTEFEDEFRRTKFVGILQHYLAKSIEEGQESIIMTQLDVMYPFFGDVLEDVSKNDLAEEIRTIFKDN
jgi:thioredoxin 1